MKEQVIEIKKCNHCNSNFNVTDDDLNFYKKISPKFNGEIFEIPTPTFCPECRQQRRLSFRNERNLYKSKCSLTWVDIISSYSPDKNYVVYENKTWWSDKWDSLDYWIEYDFSKNFFEQFDSQLHKIPRINLHLQNYENSPYSNHESDIKNCYLTVWWHWNENCMYGTYYISSKDSVDNYWLFNSTLSYENLICYNLYNCSFLSYSYDCEKCFLWFDLKWCKNCFCCVWLRNKEYYIFNKSYSKEEYENKLEKINLWNYENLDKYKKDFFDFLALNRNLEPNIVNSENCTWNDIFNSKNCHNSNDLEECEDCKNCFIVWMSKNIYDSSNIWKVDFSYEMTNGWMDAYHNMFSQFSYWCRDIMYSDNCHYSNNLFWCIWLVNKSYCILNKQYTKEEYLVLVPKIIKSMRNSSEWWEYFPSSISTYWYNESAANLEFPLNEEQAINNWFIWSNFEALFPKVKKVIPASKLPSDIKDIPDDILNRAIECEINKKPFRIIKSELDFYRKHNLPVPRRHPDQRHIDRLKLKNKI